MSSSKSLGKPARGTRARSIARKLAMQALYQWQMTQQSATEIQKQFLESEDSAGVDREHFEELVGGCIAKYEELAAVLKPFLDRPLDQLDPDVPYRVVINEAVDLCKRFGATDAHKYVNAVLDRAARELRTAERD